MKATEKYIFFIDIDGTLIKDHAPRINEETINEIHRLQQAGHIFVVSTGRVLGQALRIENIKEFDYLAVLFGSRIYKMPDLTPIYKAKNMKKITLVKLLNYLDEHQINWEYKDEVNQKTISKDEKFLKRAVAKQVTSDEFLTDLNNGNIIQLLVEGWHKDELKRFKNFNCFNMPDHYTDITNKNVSKAQCIKFFKKIYPHHTTVSIGDSNNDVEMFENTKISIAMGNASSEVKSKAKFVTTTVSENGVVYALKNILKL